MSEAAPTSQALELVEVVDERTPECEAALALIEGAFPVADRHPREELRSELEEKRRQLVPRNRPHLLAALRSGEVVGAAYGIYLAGPNCGFVAYVAVDEGERGGGIARRLRRMLAAAFCEDAIADGNDELAWIVGEVRRDSPWLEQLVRRRGAIPLDFEYFHPGMNPGGDHEPYTLYLEPMGDTRQALPVLLVRRVVYQIYRIAYRVRHPLMRPNFRRMMEELEGCEEVGPIADILARAAASAE